MRRLLLFAAGLAAIALLLGARPGDGGSGGSGYTVRAIFDNAAAAAEGEDVKVAGAKVGSIKSLEVTADRKAAITIEISDARFAPFHRDARCTLRPEGVLAVKFVECDPGRAGEPELAQIDRGDGRGDHLLPVSQTSSPIDIDLVSNTMRRPTGQQLAILLSEFGTGLAGRGPELNAVIHRANPALAETNRVVALLARQSDALEQFAEDADRVLTPLARDRRSIAGFVKNAHTTARASASRSTDVSRSIERLPAFLRALRTEMSDISALTDAGVPVLDDLERSATGLSEATAQLAPFARAGTPAIRALGATAERATPKLQRTLPLIRELGEVGGVARPVLTELDDLTSSFEKDQGIRRLTETLYYGTNAVNGFDDVGHYARAEPLSGACSEYTAKGFFGCDAQWGPTAEAAGPITAGAPAKANNVLLDYLLAP